MSDHVCPRCRSRRFQRTKRLTFMELKVWPIFGRYPWICGACGYRAMLMGRGERKSRKQKEIKE